MGHVSFSSHVRLAAPSNRQNMGELSSSFDVPQKLWLLNQELFMSTSNDVDGILVLQYVAYEMPKHREARGGGLPERTDLRLCWWIVFPC